MKHTLAERQRQLMQHLLHGDDTIAAHIVQQGNVSVATRLHIYRNAYQSRLRDTIDTDHPVTGTYLGDALFEEMVAAYREYHQSSQRSLRHYADELPGFLKANEPFSSNPQIAELVRFERLLLSAFDAAEAPRATRADLSILPVEAWPGMRPEFHPSVKLFETHWNVVSMWQAIKEDRAPPEPQQGFEAWVVWRNGDLLTEFRHLASADLWLLKYLLDGSDFATACEAMLEVMPESEVSAAAVGMLLVWLDLGLIARLSGAAEESAGTAR